MPVPLIPSLISLVCLVVHLHRSEQQTCHQGRQTRLCIRFHLTWYLPRHPSARARDRHRVNGYPRPAKTVDCGVSNALGTYHAERVSTMPSARAVTCGTRRVRNGTSDRGASKVWVADLPRLRRPLSSKLRRREDETTTTHLTSPDHPIRPAPKHLNHNHQPHPHFGDSLSFLDDVLPLEVNRPGPSTRKESRHPLSQLEDDLGAWCARHG